MRKMWRKLFTTAALACMLCLSGLVMSGTAFAERCVDNGDGTITDNGTGLMWQKATAGPMNWDNAMSYASGLTLGGHSGWGLPNRDELSGLYHSPCKNMMEVVSCNISAYWSSSTVYGQRRIPYRVDFSDGLELNVSKSNTYYVRAVRSAQ